MPAASDRPGVPEVENIGLLVVHGIGQQERFEHLKGTVSEFAELMAQAEEHTAVSVIDRTATWTLPPGEQRPDRLPPITLTVETQTRRQIYHCHEVWWADLGERAGLFDSLRFWIWGFGSWCAPVYRDLDAAQLKKTDQHQRLAKPVSRLSKIPESVAGHWLAECRARLQLLLAVLATMFVCVSWVLVKRLFAALTSTTPSPTLLVQYVGDVRVYEEPAAPGQTAISDPGFPRRVGIRRRMVAEMVAMGSNPDLDRWYVAAHSQGTVLAYNGLTEIGHTLPNYLTKDQWQTLDQAYKHDPDCALRDPDEISAMMPARPIWLRDGDVINRAKLFGKLSGFLTYGSPLNKFAGLWPRIVATATDRKDGKSVFREDCAWYNLRALQDPVSGSLDSFRSDRPRYGIKPAFAGHIPEVRNIETPVRPNYLLAHLQYFTGSQGYAKRFAVQQRRQIARWLMGYGDTPDSVRHSILSILALWAGYLGIVVLLFFLAVAFVTLAGGIGWKLISAASPAKLPKLGEFLCSMANAAPIIIDAALSLAIATGFARWFYESWGNWQSARLSSPAAARDDAGKNRILLSWDTTSWSVVVRLNFVQALTALATTALSVGAAAVAVTCGARWHLMSCLDGRLAATLSAFIARWHLAPCLSGWAAAWPLTLVLVLAIAFAVAIQAALNWVISSPRR